MLQEDCFLSLFELINGRTFALALLHYRDCDFLS